MIRFASPNDIPKVVNIHSQSLSEDYLPKLGKEVMHGYYNTFVKENTIILFEENESIIGFVALSFRPVDLKDVFAKYYKKIIIKIFLHPDLWGQTLWLVLYSKKHCDYPEISFIAVKREHRGAGIGSQLITWVCDFLSKKGIECLQVKTEANNALANNFYKKNVFNVVSVEKRFNRNFNIYLREVKSGNS